MDLISTIKELALGPNFFKTALREKRNIPRIVCNIKAYTRIQNKPLFLRITDVGIKGLKVESFIKFPVESSFNITVETDTGTLSYGGFNRDTLLVKVAWCRKQRYGDAYNIGLLFADSAENIKNSWVNYIFREFGFEEDLSIKKRESIRIPVEIPVICTNYAGITYQGTIQNIGMGGVLVKSGEEIPAGEKIALTIGPYKTFKRFSLQGKALRNKFIERTFQWLTAIQFIELTPRQYKTLGKMILDILRERRAILKG